MILHTELLEDEYGGSEIVRTLNIHGDHHRLYDLIADKGYEDSEGTPLCVMLDSGNDLIITFDPYNTTGFRKKIKLDYNEADQLNKMLIYMYKREAEEENT